MNRERIIINKNRVVLPLSYLPPVDHYCYMVSTCDVLFEVMETFPKQTLRNRTNIYTANGILRLTIPVSKPLGNKTRTCEVLIDNKTAWNKIHWKAISSAYNKSPFFLYYKDDFEVLFNNTGGFLHDFNMSLIKLINKFLKITPSMELTSEFIKVYQDEGNTNYIDQRNCRKDTGISSFDLPPYAQVFGDRLPYIPNLSILDLLFNEGPHAIQYLRKAKLKPLHDSAK